jgi:hypothetical protein
MVSGDGTRLLAAGPEAGAAPGGLLPDARHFMTTSSNAVTESRGVLTGDLTVTFLELRRACAVRRGDSFEGEPTLLLKAAMATTSASGGRGRGEGQGGGGRGGG